MSIVFKYDALEELTHPCNDQKVFSPNTTHILSL